MEIDAIPDTEVGAAAVQPLPEATEVGAAVQPQATEVGAVVQPEPGSTKPPKARKRMPQRSLAWKQFVKMENIDGERVGKCIFCAKEVPADPIRHGTSGLRNHMVTCKKKPEASDQAELNFQVGDESSSAASLTSWVFNQDASKNALAAMIVEDELPFRFVEGKGFRKFMRVVQPRFRVPSRQTTSRGCVTRYVDEKLKMKLVFGSNCQRVFITTDTWTSIQRINYMCVTAHFIDNDWKLHKKIINFCPIASHKGDAIGKTLEKCLSEWGLMTKVFTITVDNAKSNDRAVNWIRKRMIVLGASILGGEFLHVRCIAHIINLVVTNGLKNNMKSIFRIREAVRYVRQSPSRLLKFNTCAERENIECNAGLCLDVCTRWNSTYLMLESACRYERAFEAYGDLDPYFKIELDSKGLKKTGQHIVIEEEEEEDSLEDDDVGITKVHNYGGVPTEEDWNCARRFANCLRFFYDLTKFVSGSHYVTANAFFNEITNVATLLKEWQDGSDYELSIMADSMKDKLDKYWGDVTKYNSLFYISAILDPRNKFVYVQFSLNDLHGNESGGRMGKKVREEIGRLYHSYYEMYKPRKEGDATEGDKAREGRRSSNVKAAQLMDARKNRFKKFKADCGAAAEGGSELEIYLQEPAVAEDGEFVLLDWWKKHSPRFPILSKMARDVLAVPVSTVASESAFSTGGRVLDSFRSSLTPRVVQSLICTQDWLRTPNECSLVEDNITEVEKLDSELAKMVLEPAISEM